LRKTNLRQSNNATAQPVISGRKIYPIKVPMPPLNEQKRIVKKIDELFKLIDNLDSDKEKLLETIEITRNKVLQDAIQGKLVDQDPNDEPVSELLIKIEAERKKLYKDGKIRKPKKLPPIKDEEKPFDIPESWEWVRLGKIIDLISGRDLPIAQCNNEKEGIPYIMGASNINNGNLSIERWIEEPKTIAEKRDIIITVKGTVGKIHYLDEFESVNLSRQVVGIKQIGYDYNYYLFNFLKGYMNQLKKVSQGVIPGISRDDILNVLYPLPPINEQKRIVGKLDNVFSLFDILENYFDN
jgi:type I restriction enzyme S subunit